MSEILRIFYEQKKWVQTLIFICSKIHLIPIMPLTTHTRRTQSCCCSLPAHQCVSEFFSSFLNLSSFFSSSSPPQIFFHPMIFCFSHLTEESCLDCRSSCALLGILVWDTDYSKTIRLESTTLSPKCGDENCSCI